MAINKSFWDLIDKKQKATGTEFLIANLQSKVLFLRIIVAILLLKMLLLCCFLCMQIFKNAVYKAYCCNFAVFCQGCIFVPFDK